MIDTIVLYAVFALDILPWRGCLTMEHCTWT